MQALVIAIRLSITLSLMQQSGALRFSSIQMPALVQRATNFWLACQFELEPGEQLYSVKWYKNNEEFYRLLAGSGGTTGASTASTSGSDANSQLAASGEAGKLQQQYFSQAGVNVLMSASNATHVRLLNGSLESEGVYACEISSENLSTIRHEREIKVYVLPHARLSLIGLRNVYAMGERVELHCSSDLSRPGGALAWFINGHQITTNWRLFELHWQRSGQNQLERVSLTLKFKLTSQLLGHLSELANQENEWRNQSLKLSSRLEQQQQQQSPPAPPPQTSARLLGAAASSAPLELLKLDCRFKLTDVSDVTFNELKVARRTRERRHQAGRLSRRSPPATSGARAPLAKSQGQQVVQRTRRFQALLAALAASQARAQDACPLGPLALQPDDPIILQTTGSGDIAHADKRAGGEHQEAESGNDLSDEETASEAESGQRLAVASEGAALNLNCSTLSALLISDSHEPTLAASGWPLVPQRRKPPMQTGRAKSAGAHSLVELCADWPARRRAIISGKYQTTTQTQPAASISEEPSRGRAHKSASLHQQQQQQVAYVRLEHELLAGAMGGAAESAPATQVTKSLAQLEQQQQRQLAWQLRAPPLLEWFINNQEAPKASASYSPDLPLVAAPSQPASATASARRQLQDPESGNELDSNSLDGTPSGSRSATDEPDPTLLPSIDYPRYFANFEGRPLDQHLKLSLKLDKKHFMTPDSQLTLRCTSTQAQVLMVDSVSVSFLVLSTSAMIPSGDAVNGNVHQTSKWQHRLVGPNNQIKQKYLHQYPRSSSQKFASANPNYRQEYLGASQTRGSNGVCSVQDISYTKLLPSLLAQLVLLSFVLTWW